MDKFLGPLLWRRGREERSRRHLDSIQQGRLLPRIGSTVSTVSTNKRYADSIDRRAQEGAPRHPEQQAAQALATQAGASQPSATRPTATRPTATEPTATQPRDWQPPWPPIRIAEAEWIVMRDAKNEPAAVIRAVRIGPRNELFYRVVSWAPTSDDRILVGYYATLQLADRAVLFGPANGAPQPSR